MKFLLFILISLTFLSCASREGRTPSSTNKDESQNVKAERYFRAH